MIATKKYLSVHMGDENGIMTAVCSSAMHVAEMFEQGILIRTITIKMII